MSHEDIEIQNAVILHLRETFLSFFYFKSRHMPFLLFQLSVTVFCKFPFKERISNFSVDLLRELDEFYVTIWKYHNGKTCMISELFVNYKLWCEGWPLFRMLFEKKHMEQITVLCGKQERRSSDKTVWLTLNHREQWAGGGQLVVIQFLLVSVTLNSSVLSIDLYFPISYYSSKLNLLNCYRWIAWGSMLLSSN